MFARLDGIRQVVASWSMNESGPTGRPGGGSPGEIDVPELTPSRCSVRIPLMHAAATAGLGFLFAVLWFDLMFDVQATRPKRGDLSRDVVVSS